MNFGLSTALAMALMVAGAACAGDQIGGSSYGAPHDGGVESTSPAGAWTASGNAAVFFEGGTPTSTDCDMNGRWLVAQRVVAQALGVEQASHGWFYYEIRQDADQVTVTKGLQCGFDVTAIGALGANVDSHLSWPAILTHDIDTGRRGTMTVTASGCQLDVEKRYTVRGATVSFYSDVSQPMPTVSQQASGSTPGWEDWDNDGHPGITLAVSGLATGHLYVAQRDWNQWSGAVAARSTTFSVPVTWDSGQDALGYDGSSLVTQSAVPATDPTLHYVWFARLGPTQATGDDTAVCAAIRSLVPTLTPDATK